MLLFIFTKILLLLLFIYFFLKIILFFHVPGCSRMFHVPDFIDGLFGNAMTVLTVDFEMAFWSARSG